MTEKKRIKICKKYFNKIVVNKTETNNFIEELEKKLQYEFDPVVEKVFIRDDVIEGNIITLGHISEYCFAHGDTNFKLILVTDLNGYIVAKYMIETSDSFASSFFHLNLNNIIQESSIRILNK